MSSHDIETYFRQHQRLWVVLIVVIGMAAVSGVFVGMRQTNRHLVIARHEVHAAPSMDHGVPEAPKYGDIRVTDWLANEAVHFSLLDLPQASDERSPATPMTAEELQEVLERRAQRRAFDGAPPTIPHEINTSSVASCTACHGAEAKPVIDGRRPPVMSHAWYSSCTQCHVPQDGLRQLTEDERLSVENPFVGRPAPGPGSRAYPSAPPTMPHPVFMRESCMSCHGADRPQAIRSSHPQRQNCLQCHAQDAALDNRERSREPTLEP